MNTTRRRALQTTGAWASLASLGVAVPSFAQTAPNRSGFDAKTLANALKAIGGTPTVSDQVALTAPDVAEDGTMVPVGVVSRLPNTTEVYLLVEKNPMPLSAVFTIPEGTAPEIQTRLKMAQSSNVIAIVKADGKLFSAVKDTRVTLGGCGA